MAAKTKTITVELKGAAATGGDIVLTDFRDFCANLASCLRLVEEKVSPEHHLDYRIVELRRGSAVIGLEPIADESDPDTGPQVLALFSDTVKKLTTGKKPDPRMGGTDLLAFKRLAEPLGKRFASLRINRTPVTPEFTANIEHLLSRVVHSEGSVRGVLERLNVHDRYEFTMYPSVGRSVTCSFPDDLFQQVKDAIKRNVTAYGTLSYFMGSPFPEKAHVERIEIHPPDEQLPKLSELRGTLKGRLGGRSAVEIVRAIRNAKSA
jgi:hypothetical protein